MKRLYYAWLDAASGNPVNTIKPRKNVPPPWETAEYRAVHEDCAVAVSMLFSMLKEAGVS